MKLRVLKIKEIQEFVSLITENKPFQGNERKNAAYVVLKEGYDVILNIYEDKEQSKSIAMEYFQGIRDMIVNKVEIDNYYEDFYDWNDQMDCDDCGDCGDCDDCGDCGDCGDFGDLPDIVCSEGEIERPKDDRMERNNRNDSNDGEKNVLFPPSHKRVKDKAYDNHGAVQVEQRPSSTRKRKKVNYAKWG